MVTLDPDRYDPALKRGATFDAGNLGAGSVEASEIAAGAVGASELASGAVDSADIAAGAVDETHLAASVNKIVTGSFDLADSSASYFFYVQNPESSTIYVDDVIVVVSTASGAAGTMDVGTHMTTAASVDGMYVGKNMNATGVHSIAGTSTGSILEVTSSDGFVIGDLGSGTTGDAAGTYRIVYHT